jgi:dephospho-CoA kinase
LASFTKQKFSVGLTGGIGSGKSTVADLFAARGASLIDTDLIAHQLTAPGGAAIAQISQAFGSGVLLTNGALDRTKMRERVFANASEKARLEQILHPLIRRACEAQALAASGPYLIFAVPLLVESGTWKDRVDRVLVVDCPEQMQITRVIQRSGLSEAQVRAIMSAQASRAERLAAADDVISNANGIESLVPQVDRLHTLYRALAHGPTP